MNQEHLVETRSEPIHGARTRILAGDGLSKMHLIQLSRSLRDRSDRVSMIIRKVIATRVLQHSHNHEQPFMCLLSHVKIPAGLNKVTVRAYDSVHGYGGKTAEVDVRKEK